MERSWSFYSDVAGAQSSVYSDPLYSASLAGFADSQPAFPAFDPMCFAHGSLPGPSPYTMPSSSDETMSYGSGHSSASPTFDDNTSYISTRFVSQSPLSAVHPLTPMSPFSPPGPHDGFQEPMMISPPWPPLDPGYLPPAALDSIPSAASVMSPSHYPGFYVHRLHGVEHENATARSHEYYRATKKDDGLFHCPFALTEGCTHKPEALKCNYE